MLVVMAAAVLMVNLVDVPWHSVLRLVTTQLKILLGVVRVLRRGVMSSACQFIVKP